MTRYVIGPDIALRLARDAHPIPDQHQLLAPTLLRSQVLSLLFQSEYVAHTRLKADAFINLDPDLARSVRDLVRIGPISALRPRQA